MVLNGLVLVHPIGQIPDDGIKLISAAIEKSNSVATDKIIIICGNNEHDLMTAKSIRSNTQTEIIASNHLNFKYGINERQKIEGAIQLTKEKSNDIETIILISSPDFIYDFPYFFCRNIENDLMNCFQNPKDLRHGGALWLNLKDCKYGIVYLEAHNNKDKSRD